MFKYIFVGKQFVKCEIENFAYFHNVPWLRQGIACFVFCDSRATESELVGKLLLSHFVRFTCRF